MKPRINIDSLFENGKLVDCFDLECNDGSFLITNKINNKGLMVTINESNLATICLLANSVYIRPNSITIEEECCETILDFSDSGIAILKWKINEEEKCTELIINEEEI